MFGNRNKTFVPNKKRKNTKRYQGLYKYAQASLGAEHIAEEAPEHGDKREWLAVMADSFTSECVILSEQVAARFCTDISCPIMNAGPNYKFLWQDPLDKGSKPVELSARQYSATCLDWILSLLDDEAFFPQDSSVPFPKDFDKRVKKIFKRLIRIYAHWYRSHLPEFEAAGAVAHLNTCFRHLYSFCTTNKLADDKDWAPIQSEVEVIVNSPTNQQ